MAYNGDRYRDLAYVYALDLNPRINIRPSSYLGLYYDRPYQEYRILRRSLRLLRPGSTQLELFPEDA